MTLAELVAVSQQVGATRGRKEKIEHLAGLLRALPPDEVATGVAYLCGELPQGRIGIGPALIAAAREAPAAAAGPLTLADVDRTVAEISARRGAGSAATRERLLAGLFARASADERDFLARLLFGELRQGALAGIVAEGLARAAGIEPQALRRALMLGERGAVARAALAEGAAGLSRFALTVFHPVQPMLAQTADGVEPALAQLGGSAAFEHKLDGARIQVHRRGDDVRVFSRALNDVTAAVPEVVAAARALPATELVLDGEALALDGAGRPRPFQVTMRRFGRKLDVETLRAELTLTPFYFDLLLIDGRPVVDREARERAQALAELAPGQVVPRSETSDPAEAGRILAAALAAGHEGVMAKSLIAPYEAGARGAAWLKVKPAHTLDLVVLAVEWGSGRRKGWLSNLHLGARDPEGGAFVMLGKTFKGMTDEMLAWQTGKLLALETGRDGHVVRVRPELVVEVAFDGVQESSQYPGGLALRFARVKRYREDKDASQADTIATVRALGCPAMLQHHRRTPVR